MYLAGRESRMNNTHSSGKGLFPELAGTFFLFRTENYNLYAHIFSIFFPASPHGANGETDARANEGAAGPTESIHSTQVKSCLTQRLTLFHSLPSVCNQNILFSPFISIEFLTRQLITAITGLV